MKTSISDTNKYKSIIQRMLQDQSTFNNFKRLPDYTEILEHTSFSLGSEYLKKIIQNNPQLLNHIFDFKSNDIYGNPTKYYYNETGDISPTTLRYIKVLSDLISMNIDLNDKDIIEIGVGYGGQCLILSKYFNFKSYTLVDLKEPLTLSEKYLKLHNVNNVIFKEMDNLDNTTTYDLLISNYAFTECTKEVQEIYYERALKNSKHGYITANFISDIFDIKSYTKEELLNLINGSKAIQEEPITGNNNFILIW